MHSLEKALVRSCSVYPGSSVIADESILCAITQTAYENHEHSALMYQNQEEEIDPKLSGVWESNFQTLEDEILL